MFIFFFRKFYIIPTFFSKKDITIIYNLLTPFIPIKNDLQLVTAVTPSVVNLPASVDLTTAPRLWSVSTPAIRFRSSSWEFQQLVEVIPLMLQKSGLHSPVEGKVYLCHDFTRCLAPSQLVGLRISEPSTVWKSLGIVEKLIQEGVYQIFNVSFEFSDLCFSYCLLISSHLICRGVSIWCFEILVVFVFEISSQNIYFKTGTNLGSSSLIAGRITPPLPLGKNPCIAATEVLVSFQVL